MKVHRARTRTHDEPDEEPTKGRRERGLERASRTRHGCVSRCDGRCRDDLTLPSKMLVLE
jgi:hypothetical protein